MLWKLAFPLYFNVNKISVLKKTQIPNTQGECGVPKFFPFIFLLMSVKLNMVF